MTALDRRLNAFRPDLADARLRGRVEAACFIEGSVATICVPVADLHATPDQASGIDTQLLHGDRIRIFERKDSWAWLQSERDGYVGYVEESALSDAAEPATHVVRVPRSFIYPEPELKAPPVRVHSMGAKLTVTGEIQRRGTRYAILSSGEAMIFDHLRPLDEHAPDYVAIAEELLNTPYLWGGASGFGIDCSGLVQLSMLMSGIAAPRDTDMQARELGRPLAPDPSLRRGDLVFWRGHVAVMTDGEHVIHANGNTMLVSRESLDQAVNRIEPLFGLPTGFRRPLG